MTVSLLTQRVDLPLPGIGTAAARVTVLEHGRVRYVVRAPHVRGTFVVIPQHLRDGPVLPDRVVVQFGDGLDPQGTYYWRKHRPDEPVVHGVRLHGWTSSLQPDNLSDRYIDILGSYTHSLRGGALRELPRATRRRTETVIRAILAHWRSLPQLDQLRAAAARIYAAEYAEHEAERAAAAEAQVAQLQTERKQARRRVNVLNGIRRRRPRALTPPRTHLARLPLVDGRGREMGSITVREVAVSAEVAGAVVYEVSGARVLGRFTVGSDIYRAAPVPQGVWVAYGHATRTHFENERAHRPTVNGVTVSGGWNHDTSDDITPSAPNTVGARVETSPTTGHSAPAATERRAGAVVRALALHFLAREDLDGLRLAAAQANAPFLLGETRRRLKDLAQQQAQEERNAQRHRLRERQLQGLTTSQRVGFQTELAA
ncbi:hypothetical protein [Streptomyces venezuelae]|uniref:hypothetical protein n=1 Tax=Streptomyces venezuelae TaxID=54571 RepID=UPI0034308B4C